MLTAAISGAVMHPLVADLDDVALGPQLLRLARRLFELPDGDQSTQVGVQVPSGRRGTGTRTSTAGS
jgi:hypothetical protein